jgi:putative ABC transport system permease protein
MKLAAVGHGIGMAWDALRANRVRAVLMTAGMVIGVATVMSMAALITGVRSAVTDELMSLGPDNFVIARFDVGNFRLADLGEGKSPWAGNPPVTLREAALVSRLPSVERAVPSVTGSATLRAGRTTMTGVEVQGSGAEWPASRAGTFRWGRNFLPAEVDRSANVVVLSDALATELFGPAPPPGATVYLAGLPFRVTGVYRARGNVFTDESDRWIVAPYTTTLKHLAGDAGWMEVLVVPRAGVGQARAMNDVTAALRTARRLRPMQPSTFALTGQAGVQTLFDDTTGMFFVVMLVLSSVGLMVGGVGVVAIMMIAVTERTREIGIRKALGATRQEILWQFLVEAATVTAVGGAAGVAIAGGGALLLARLTPLPASVPLWSVAAGVGVSALCGLVFGIAPASRAARLDPVEALRYQ